ncbi:hypothetical protein J4429_02140 [Candidatus Pacearchaeota archaeon]|nr:hypothetical protein [Candidatus Pacearchaeota archaeon]
MKKRRLKINNKNPNLSLKKTLIIAIIFSIITIIIAIIIQLNGQSKITEKCSYLDPWTIDLLAFSAALFLVIEGFARIIEHPHASLKRQFTRIIRIMFGFSILTLHIIQFIHK